MFVQCQITLRANGLTSGGRFLGPVLKNKVMKYTYPAHMATTNSIFSTDNHVWVDCEPFVTNT